MTDSQPHQIMKSGLKTADECSSKKLPHNISDLHKLVKVGDRFNSWEITSSAWREKGHRKVKAKCTTCGAEKTVFYDNLKAGKSVRCHQCATRKTRWKGGRSTPDWLRRRFTAAKNRCTSPGDARWESYGGRGIEFRFESVDAAAQWMITNCGLPDRSMELDRINNDGHYEPGNLRWATRHQNVHNRRCSVIPEDWVYDDRDWPFCEKTVRMLLTRGMTRDQIIERARDVVKRRKGRWSDAARWFAYTTS